MSTTTRLTIRLKATRHIEPPPRLSSQQWLEDNVTMPDGTETSGMPFSMAAFPHVDGVLQAFDDPSVRTIVLQWGTRLGKTTTCLSLMARVAGTMPRNMMFASSTKDSAGRVVSSRLYPLLASTEKVRKQLLPEHRRSKLDVRLEACRIYIGWSGSETSLADVGAWFGVANEIDKWDEQASSEADSLALFLNRFKGFPNHKIILESTPTIKGTSRVDNWMQRSNIHRRQVPCPHCGEYQILRKGVEETPGGFRWEKTPDGKNDPDLAFRTAWYECGNCRGRIENHHRIPMLRRGIWVPDGCSVSKEGQIEGTATKAGSDVVGFGPLPSWYALTETWGGFARAWLRAQRKPRDLQDVVNSYMAECWEVKRVKSDPEKVADRITGLVPPRIVPIGGLFLTVTVDRQQADGGFNPWVLLAHGADDRVWEIDHGQSNSLLWIWENVMRKTYQHEDQGPDLTPIINAVDSGWATKETYEFCSSRLGVIPCKGSTGDLGGQPYKIVELTDKSRSDSEGQLLMHINTDFWETSLQSMLEDRLANEPGSLTIAKRTSIDVDFMSQLCNGTLSDKKDSRGNQKLTWTKLYESQPNDFRDCIRYGMALARSWIDSEGLPVRGTTASNPVPEAEPKPFVRNPTSSQSSGGWVRRGSR